MMGVFSKYGAFPSATGSSPSLDYGRDWMLNARATNSRAAWDSGTGVRAHDPHAHASARSAISRGRLGCVDYSMKDGRVVVWEINLHPGSVGPA